MGLGAWAMSARGVSSAWRRLDAPHAKTTAAALSRLLKRDGVPQPQRLLTNLETVIRGKREPLSRVLCCMAAGGHVLLEDIPRHGAKLAQEFREVGARIKAEAEKEIAEAEKRNDPDYVPPEMDAEEDESSEEDTSQEEKSEDTDKEDAENDSEEAPRGRER